MNDSEGEIGFGNKLKMLRIRLCLTKSNLAAYLGVSHTYIGLLEKGDRCGSENFIKKLAIFFNTDENELLELRRKKNSSLVSDEITGQNGYPIHIKRLADMLVKLDQRKSQQMVDRFINHIRKIKLINN